MNELQPLDPATIDLAHPPPMGRLSRRLSGPSGAPRRPSPEELLKDRLVVVETVVFQPAAGNPTVAPESGFSRFLQTHEQPVGRTLTAGEEWQPVEGHWLKQAGQLSLRNDEGRTFIVQPTEAERREIAERVLEVGAVVAPAQHPSAFAEVPPGESCRFRPSDLAALRVRCRKGTAKFTLTLMPT